MDLTDLLKLMHEAAKLTNKRVCLGIQVRPDGSGRTTPGSLNDGSNTTGFKVGPGKLEWDSSLAGGAALSYAIRKKVAGERKECSEQVGIFTLYD